MNKKTKQKWVKALRSGEYQQTIHYLKTAKATGFDEDGNEVQVSDKPGYCCLGVACDLFKLSSKALRIGKYSGQSRGFGRCDVYEGEQKLSKKALKILGITNNQQERLVAMNDNGDTFEQIANYIEQDL